MLSPLTIPSPEAPEPLEGYGLPTRPVLSWAFVAERMQAARNYWIVTVDPDGAPHAVPVWGLWHGDRVYFDGSPETRWARNLAANPAIAVHLPDAEQVVLIEGRVVVLDDDALAADRAALTAAYAAKYDMESCPNYVVEPQLVLAWDSMESMTRWQFD